MLRNERMLETIGQKLLKYIKGKKKVSWFEKILRWNCFIGNAREDKSKEKQVKMKDKY